MQGVLASFPCSELSGWQRSYTRGMQAFARFGFFMISEDPDLQMFAVGEKRSRLFDVGRVQTKFAASNKQSDDEAEDAIWSKSIVQTRSQTDQDKDDAV